jgi:hypothetical protein
MDRQVIKKVIVSSLALALVLAVSPAWARSSVSQDGDFELPRHAKRLNDDTYSLGFSFDRASRRFVKGVAFVHKEKPVAETSDLAVCYGYIAGGIKWKSPEPWLMNTANRRKLPSTEVFNIMTNALSKWEVAAGTTEGSPKDIFGAGTNTTLRLRADTRYPDGKNEVYFANVRWSGAIAVTIVWYTLSGSIVEWDQIYDDRDYNWSLTGEAGKMDFDNIATHENGHSAGMDDMYEAACSEVTMYGYADYGEIKKRDLHPDDITGIDLLY